MSTYPKRYICRSSTGDHRLIHIKWLLIFSTFGAIIFLLLLQNKARIFDQQLEEQRARYRARFPNLDIDKEYPEQEYNDEFEPADPFYKIHGFSLKEIYENVYRKHKLYIDLETRPLLQLKHLERPTCEMAFHNTEDLASLSNKNENSTQEMSEVEFTMNGVALKSGEIKTEVTSNSKNGYNFVEFLKNVSIPSAHKMEPYLWSLVGLDSALSNYRVDGKRGIIFGSESPFPFAEVLSLRHNAQHLTIVESKTNQYNDARIEQLSPREMSASYSSYIEKYDFAVSFNHLARIGLGIIGDTINPNGDIQEMNKIACSVKRGGLLYFAEKIGRDAVDFRKGRIYGRIRIPMLFAGWKVEATYLNDQQTAIILGSEWLDTIWTDKEFYPVFVLRKI